MTAARPGEINASNGPGALFADRCYGVIEQIGVGGMAVVYLAEDQVLMRKVAVKRLDAESRRRDPEIRARGEDRGGPQPPEPGHGLRRDTGGRDVLIVMEYVDGLDLARR